MAEPVAIFWTAESAFAPWVAVANVLDSTNAADLSPTTAPCSSLLFIVKLTAPFVEAVAFSVIAPVLPPNDCTPLATAVVTFSSSASIASCILPSLYVPSPPTRISPPVSTTLAVRGLVFTVLEVGTFALSAPWRPVTLEIAKVGMSVSTRALRETVIIPSVSETAETTCPSTSVSALSRVPIFVLISLVTVALVA